MGKFYFFVDKNKMRNNALALLLLVICCCFAQKNIMDNTEYKILVIGQEASGKKGSYYSFPATAERVETENLRFVSAAVSSKHSLLLTSDSRLFAFGDNANGTCMVKYFFYIFFKVAIQKIILLAHRMKFQSNICLTLMTVYGKFRQAIRTIWCSRARE